MRSTIGLVPGLRSEEHKARWLEGRQRFFAAGGPLKCTALAKHGGPCRGKALRGHKFCRYHAPPDVKRKQRLKRLARLPSGTTPEQIERAARREAARMQRVIWRKDRWSPGATVTLGEREALFRSSVHAAGFDPDWLSPASIDAGRWAWLQVQVGRMSEGELRVRLAWHVGRDQAQSVA